MHVCYLNPFVMNVAESSVDDWKVIFSFLHHRSLVRPRCYFSPFTSWQTTLALIQKLCLQNVQRKMKQKCHAPNLCVMRSLFLSLFFSIHHTSIDNFCCARLFLKINSSHTHTHTVTYISMRLIISFGCKMVCSPFARSLNIDTAYKMRN